MKLSFSLSSKPPSSRPNPTKPPQSFHPQPSENGTPQPQFVTVFDPSKTLASSNVPTVIPPLPNADLFRSVKMKNLLPPPSSDDPVPSETKFVLDTSADPVSTVSYGLTLRSKAAPDPIPRDEEGGDSDATRRPEPAKGGAVLRRFRDDMDALPDDGGFDEFAVMPVDGFGAALLAGFGWSKGMGIGLNAKEDTKVVEAERRITLNGGIGYVPSPGDPKSSKRKRILERRAGPEEETSLKKSNLGRPSEPEEDKSLKKSNLGILKRDGQKDESRSRDSKREEKRSAWKDESRSRDSTREEKRSGEHKREVKRAWVEEVKPTEKSSNGDSRVQWLRSDIRVRVIGRDFRRGKLYRQKGKVVDVVGPTTCVLMMDGSGELVEGVGQEILETALPKRGGSVIVLYGKHKGVFGSLVERDMDEETAVVEDADSHARVNVRLDQIAEYVGDPSNLGY